MGGSCKERYTKDENNKLERLQQKPDQMEETSWEGQNFYEVVAPQEEEEEEELIIPPPMPFGIFRKRNVTFLPYGKTVT